MLVSDETLAQRAAVAADLDSFPEHESEAVGPEFAQVVRECVDIVDSIKRDEPGAMQRLYDLFGRGVRFYLFRHLGSQEIEDKVHDTFLIVVEAIRTGELREPERLMGFVRTVVRRQVASWIDCVVHLRKDQSDIDASESLVDGKQVPEARMIRRERIKLMVEVLRELPARDREILERFYLGEQSAHEICEELGLSETQFRLLKSRAKTRFGQVGRKKLLQRALGAMFLRGGA